LGRRGSLVPVEALNALRAAQAGAASELVVDTDVASFVFKWRQQKLDVLEAYLAGLTALGLLPAVWLG
jgi:hypothetical protein